MFYLALQISYPRVGSLISQISLGMGHCERQCYLSVFMKRSSFLILFFKFLISSTKRRNNELIKLVRVLHFSNEFLSSPHVQKFTRLLPHAKQGWRKDAWTALSEQDVQFANAWLLLLFNENRSRSDSTNTLTDCKADL